MLVNVSHVVNVGVSLLVVPILLNIGVLTQVIVLMFVESVERVMVTKPCSKNTSNHTTNTNHSHVIYVEKVSTSIGISLHTKRLMQMKVLLVVFSAAKFSANEVIC